MLTHPLLRLRAAARHLLGFVDRRRQDDELDQELEFHLSKAVERHMHRGLSAEDAQRAALVTFGGRAQWTEATRDEQRSGWFDDVWRDLRHGAASLRRNPTFAASAIVTIAVGLAATTSVFSVVNAIYLRPLPVPEGARLVRIYGADHPTSERSLGFPDYRLLRQHARSFDVVALHYSTAPLYLTSQGESAEVTGAVVSANYFPMTGIRPALGRFFTEDEDAVPDRDAVAVIGYGLWQSRFGGDPHALGEHVTINGRTFTVVGVAPAEFDGVLAGTANELWIPAMMLHVGYRWCDAFLPTCATNSIMARLAPGVSIEAARAEISALRGALIQLTDPADSVRRIAVMSADGVPRWRESGFGNLALLLSAIAIILMIVSCANLSGLLLARGLVRQREIALRASLGASRWRLARYLLSESLIVGAIGGAAGLVLSHWTSRALVGFFDMDNEGYFHRLSVPVDHRVLLFGALATLVAVAGFGLAPALRLSSVDPADILKNGSWGSARARARTVLVGGQILLAVVLTFGAALMTRSFSHLMAGVAFDPSHAVQLRLRPRLMGYEPEKAQQYLRRAMDAMRAVPGVMSVSPVRGSIVRQSTNEATVSLPGEAIVPGRAQRIEFFDVGPSYFETLNVPLVAGRDFSEHDTPYTPLVALVNDALAKRLWPDGDVVGRSLVLDGKQFQVVGVVRSYRVRRTVEPVAPMAFTDFWQSAFEPQVDARVAIRVRGDPLAMLHALRRAAMSADPNVPVTEALSMQSQMRATFAQVRLGGAVLLVGAIIALLLSAVGLYGVVSFLAARRAREMAIRLAIGARPVNVVALMVRQGLRPIAIGGMLGVVVSVLVAPLLAQWLFGVQPFDGIAIAAAVTSVCIVALVANYLPARRAAMEDPASAIRCE